jgi:hypothetical protein
MKLFSLVENVFLKLSGVPGLGFLSGYVTEFHSRKTRLRQTADLYRGYVASVRDAGGEVVQATRGSKKDEESDADEDEVENNYEEDDDESYLQ